MALGAGSDEKDSRRHETCHPRWPRRITEAPQYDTYTTLAPEPRMCVSIGTRVHTLCEHKWEQHAATARLQHGTLDVGTLAVSRRRLFTDFERTCVATALDHCLCPVRDRITTQSGDGGLECATSMGTCIVPSSWHRIYKLLTSYTLYKCLTYC